MESRGAVADLRQRVAGEAERSLAQRSDLVERVMREAQAQAAAGTDAVEALPVLWGLAGDEGAGVLRSARSALLDELVHAENQALVQHAVRLLNAAIRTG